MSEINTKDLKYFMTLKEWTGFTVVIGVNFTKPLMISAGSKNDQVKIDILDKIYFVSAETGVVIDPSNGFENSAQVSIPPQLPEGVSEEEVQSTAQAGSRGAVAIVIIQVILQVFLKGSMDELFNLFLIL